MNLAGIDVGTSGVKCGVYSEDGKLLVCVKCGYDYVNSDKGYCLDGNVVWKSTKKALKQAAVACRGDISGIAVSAIGEACVLMNADDQILSPSILYNDKRGTVESKQFIRQFNQKEIFKRCGVSSNGTYSLEKLMWIRKHEAYFDKVDKIFLFEDFVTFCLTGERAISYSLASRTMGFDLVSQNWWEDAFAFAGVSTEKMSTPQKSAHLVGTIRKKLANELGIKSCALVFTGGHDHSCCTLGAGMIYPEISVNVSGSGDTISTLLNYPIIEKRMLEGGFCNAPYTLEGLFTTYGLCAMSGTMLRWFKRIFYPDKGTSFYSDMEKKIEECETEIIVFPGFSALGTPDFGLDTTGTIDGLTLKSTSAEIYRAMMECVAFHIKMNRQLLDKETTYVRIVGGGSNSKVWNQIKADILNCEIQKVENQEAGTVGCAMLAGIGSGLYHSAAEAAEVLVHVSDVCVPEQKKQEFYEEKYQKFLELYYEKIKRMEGKKCL